ncbi:MAG: thymidylate kinase [Pseudoalteromonas tetraodonis]|jgi:thymidylate kinase
MHLEKMTTIEQEIPHQSKSSQTTLTSLLSAFGAAGVPVVLWKGMERVERALCGDGDLDLLVGEGGSTKASQIMTEHGFCHIENARWRTQPSVDDWFGVERFSGRLLHVQLYRRLVLGSANSVQINVPGAEGIFARAVGELPKAASPADAAALRICRAALARWFLPGRSREALLAEAREIQSTLGEADLADAAGQLFDHTTAGLIVSGLASGRLGRLRRRLKEEYRLVRAGGEGPLPYCLTVVARLNRRFFRLPILTRRRLGKPAPIVALIGSDGSGKSTVSRRLVDELDKKIDTRFIYFGTGDGPASLLRLPLIWLRSIRSRAGSSGAGKDGESAESESPQVPGLAKALWAITVAIERRAKLRRARRAAASGIVVITDRFPQIEFPGIHDGPRLARWLELKGGLRHRISVWEQGVYRRIAETPPDLVVLLDVTLEVALARRPEEPENELRRRIEVARSLTYSGTCRMIEDASQPLDTVVAGAFKQVVGRIGA